MCRWLDHKPHRNISRSLTREVPPKLKLKNLLVNDTTTEEHEIGKNGDTI